MSDGVASIGAAGSNPFNSSQVSNTKKLDELQSTPPQSHEGAGVVANAFGANAGASLGQDSAIAGNKLDLRCA